MPPLRPLEPKAPRKKKSTRSGIIVSAVAVLVVMFSLGYFPQANAFFANADTELRSHNDVIVAAIIRDLPLALIVIGVSGLLLMVLGRVNRQRRAA